LRRIQFLLTISFIGISTTQLKNSKILDEMKILNLLACSVLLIATASCEHKELCYDHPHIGRVNVVFDWRNAPDAHPESMYLFLYHSDGSGAEQFEFAGRDGGIIEIEEGEYTAICINSDTEKIRYNLATADIDDPTHIFDRFIVSTETTSLTDQLEGISKAAADVAPRAEGAEQERVVYAPEPIWTDTEADIQILNVKVNKNQTITLYPQQAYCNYTVKLLNIANADMVSEMSATLSGMAGGLYVAQRTPTNEAVTIPFGVSFSASDATGEGNLRTFGHCPEGIEHSHTVVVYAVMTNGSKYYYTVDVTDQVHNAPDPYNVVITIDNVPLPDPITMGSGQGINVDEWDSVIIELSMKTD
jgi:hypothetical protein